MHVGRLGLLLLLVTCFACADGRRDSQPGQRAPAAVATNISTSLSHPLAAIAAQKRAGSSWPAATSRHATGAATQKDDGSVSVDAPGAAAAVRLPPRADGIAEVYDRTSSVALGLHLHGAAARGAELQQGVLTFPGGWRGEGDLSRVLLDDGFEDLVALKARPTEERLRYELHLTGAEVALRTVGRAVEVLDASGTPRLRMAPPYVIDGEGKRRAPSVALEGCRADSRPAAPWGRPTTAPGSSSCVVRIDWAGLGVVYPALIDPLWQSAAGMADLRVVHTATRLASGKVLVVGGQGIGANDSAELFDPATRSWATADSLPGGQGVSWHTADLLPDGRVLVAGGFGDAASIDTTFLYDETTGAWSTGGPLNEARNAHVSALLADGRVLVAGGEGQAGDLLATAEIFDPAAGLWTPAGSMGFEVQFSRAATLPDGRVMVAGGETEDIEAITQVSLFDPDTGEWSPGPAMAQPRWGHELTELPGGDLLVTGGFEGGPDPHGFAEVFHAASDTWTSVAPLQVARAFHIAAPLPGARVVVGGGLDNLAGGAVIDDAEIYDVMADTWAPIDPMITPRQRATATVLADDSVLVTGGASPDILSSVERFTLLTNGEACTTKVACASGACADGVCCDTPCDGACRACTAALKGSGTDGSCGPVAADTDPKGDCLDSGAAVCDLDGRCDGAGACSKYPTATGCAPRPCSEPAECESGACAEGICCDRACDGPCLRCTKASGGVQDGVCAAAPGSDHCKPYRCNDDGSCKAACGSVDDCLPPNVCSTDGECLDPGLAGDGDGSAADDGCGCRMRGQGQARLGWVAILAVVAGGLGGRSARRNRRASPASRR